MTNSPYDTYTSPLATRNASPEMLRLWSARHKFNTWRRIWLAVAEAQHELGIGLDRDGADRASGREPLVTKEQVEELRAVVNRPGGITDDEIRLAEKYERELRHDVMAHVHALGDACPKARGIIHLGMTSEDVGSNADLLVLGEGVALITTKIARCIDTIAGFCSRTAAAPTLAFTHYQPAQPTTIGRRAAVWASVLTFCRSNTAFKKVRLRGLRGATGTQASFLALCGGDAERVDDLESRVLWKLIETSGTLESHLRLNRELAETLKAQRVSSGNPGIDRASDRLLDEEFERATAIGYIGETSLGVTGQTYPRVIDTFILADLASTASVLHKIATDIRLLANRKELDEPFEDKQIGSSAMPYKRNPMRCERICGLCRFVMNIVGNAYDTAATQWLERTLDDSSNRRLSLPEAFLALDGALDLMHNVASGLIVHEAMVRRNLMAELPFLATENILMACVKAGGDRQKYHELIRVHAQAAGARVKDEGHDNDLLERLQRDPAFHTPALKNELDWSGLMDPMKYIGRSVEQTERFIKEVVEPLREQYKDEIAKLGESGPRV